jgi:hypothetical protein
VASKGDTLRVIVPVQSGFTEYVPSTVTGLMSPFELTVAVALVRLSPVPVYQLLSRFLDEDCPLKNSFRVSAVQ